MLGRLGRLTHWGSPSSSQAEPGLAVGTRLRQELRGGDKTVFITRAAGQQPAIPGQESWYRSGWLRETGAAALHSKKMLSVCPSLALLTSLALLPTTPPTCNLDSSPAGRAHHRANVATMARVYADVNQNMPRSYWDYDSVNIGQSRSSPCLAAFCRPSSLVSRLRRP